MQTHECTQQRITNWIGAHWSCKSINKTLPHIYHPFRTVPPTPLPPPPTLMEKIYFLMESHKIVRECQTFLMQKILRDRAGFSRIACKSELPTFSHVRHFHVLSLLKRDCQLAGKWMLLRRKERWRRLGCRALESHRTAFGSFIAKWFQ